MYLVVLSIFFKYQIYIKTYASGPATRLLDQKTFKI